MSEENKTETKRACPVCGCAEGLIAKKAAELKAAGKFKPGDYETLTFQHQFSSEKNLLTEVIPMFRGMLIRADFCSNCGCLYYTETIDIEQRANIQYIKQGPPPPPHFGKG